MNSLSSSGLLHRSHEEETQELALDLAAAWDAADLDSDVASWMTRPGILRRIAAALSLRIPPDVDRIVAIGPGAQALGAATSLATGIDYAVLEGDGFGSVRPGERVIVIAALDSEDPAGLPPQAVCVSSLVVARRHRSGTIDDHELFVMNENGRLGLPERISE
jgi:hypothetical protein